MEQRQLLYFCETYKYGNFSKAAENCFITPQGISIAISRLEEELKCQLFKRTSKGVTPTEDADELYDYAQRILKLHQSCVTHFSQKYERQKTLTVYFALGTMHEFAAPLMDGFMQKYPNIRLETVETTDIMCENALETGKTGIALITNPMDTNAFSTELLFKQPDYRHTLVVRSDHPLAAKETASIADIDGIPVTMMNEETKIYGICCRAAAKAGIRLNVQMLMSDPNSIYYYVENYNAVGISAMGLARRMNHGQFKLVPFKDPEFSWEIYFVKLKNANLTAEEKAFERVMLQNKKIVL